ncbi:MFS transporter, partial [Nocardia sp. NPDC059239]|uniref:MFS transporter n=1 Tax=Nocardia sp. NPDC059239 TaxID=3346785 RepID=UPI00368F8E04
TTTGLWVQRIAQDWLVLSLTGSATAVGITTALQWAPSLIFGLAGGWIADHYPKRRVLQLAQAAAAVAAAVLAGLTLTHHVTAWHVQLLAAALGTVAAIEVPVRQAFIADMVEPAQLRSAISLGYSVFYLGNFAGPAISGVLITAVGPGWAFALNAISYSAPLIAYARINPQQLHHADSRRRATATAPGDLRAQLRRPDIWQPITLGGTFAMFTLNLPVILTTSARTAHTGPAGYALLTGSVALASVLGGLISARRTRTSLRGLAITGYCLAGTYAVAAAVPAQWSLACALMAVGAISTQLFTATNANVQLATDHALRGRIIGIYQLIQTGSAALGGPILGLIVEHYGPRFGLALAGAIPAAAALLVALAHIIYRRITAPASTARDIDNNLCHTKQS